MTHEVVARLQSALERGDLPTARPGSAEDATLHLPGRSGLTGLYHASGAIAAFLAKLTAITEDALRFHTERVLGDGDLVLMLGEFSQRARRGRRASAVLAITVRADGITDIRLFHDDQLGVGLEALY